MALAIFCFSLVPGEAKEKEVVVSKVIDGDTVMLENGDIVQYLGIDAPKLKKNEGGPEFYAREAAKYNKSLVLMKKVRLEFDVKKKDAQGKLLAYVYVKDKFVNAELVRLGYARADIGPPDLRHKELLLQNEKEAIAKDAGLWQEAKKDSDPFYVGNKRTYTFHKPSCPLSSKIPEKNRIIFRSRTDPIQIGYTPCKKCKP